VYGSSSTAAHRRNAPAAAREGCRRLDAHGAPNGHASSVAAPAMLGSWGVHIRV